MIISNKVKTLANNKKSTNECFLDDLFPTQIGNLHRETFSPRSLPIIKEETNRLFCFFQENGTAKRKAIYASRKWTTLKMAQNQWLNEWFFVLLADGAFLHFFLKTHTPSVFNYNNFCASFSFNKYTNKCTLWYKYT